MGQGAGDRNRTYVGQFTKLLLCHSAAPAKAARAGIEPAGNVFNGHAQLPTVALSQSKKYPVSVTLRPRRFEGPAFCY